MEIIEGEARDNNISDHLIITYELKGNKLDNSMPPLQKKSFRKKQINELTTMLVEDDNLMINDWPQKSIKEIIIKDLTYRKATIRMYEPPKEYKILKGKDLEDFHLDYRKRQWAKTVEKMDKAERVNDTGTVHQIARKICKDGNRRSPPVNSIIDQSGNTINDHNEQGKLVSEYFGEVYKQCNLDDQESIVPEKTIGSFTMDEITNALEEINWKKAMGPDLLISENFNTEEGWKLLTEAVHNIMNADVIPEYLREGDLFILSKNGIDTCLLKEIRPIVLLCFITKVM
jgi:hypothetical protein